MKIQCSCGAKYEFEVAPELAQKPLQFVCPSCGLDSSDFVNQLIRQELALAAPVGSTSSAPEPPPEQARPLRVRLHQAEAGTSTSVPSITAAPQTCPKHPGELANQHCYVCSKPICPKCMELFGYVCSPLCKAKAQAHGINVPIYQGQRAVIEGKFWRRLGRTAVATAIILFSMLAFWVWYTWFGSAPKVAFSVRFPTPAYAGQAKLCEQGQLVFLHGGTLERWDLKSHQQAWARPLIDHKQIEDAIAQELKAMQKIIDRANNVNPDNAPKMPDSEKLRRSLERQAEADLELRVSGHNIWVRSAGKLALYDWASGNPRKEIAFQPGELIARGDEMLVINREAVPPEAQHINLTSAETHSTPLGSFDSRASGLANLALNPPADQAAASSGRPLPAGGLPAPGRDGSKAMDPAKVAEQASRLSYAAKIALPATLANARVQERTLAEMDDSRPAAAAGRLQAASDSVSIFPSPNGFVQFTTRLLEYRVVSHSAMKAAPAKSVLEGNLTVAQTTEAANEILNQMQRDRGGDVVQEDQSRYQVQLRNQEGTGLWKGEVIGPPTFYPLQTVNVLAANKSITVFDKANRQLWQSTLAFNVSGPFQQEDALLGQGPCVERQNSLLVFDEGVLTAFDLAKGDARWRLPSVGVAGLFFDDKDMLYVNTTTASHDRLKYSRQIDISEKANTMVLKIDSKTGKVLWTAESRGLINYVAGKYIFTVQSYRPDEAEEEDPYTPETGLETPPYLRIRRLNPKNGAEMWQHFQQRAPLDVEFDQNSISLVFKKEVQLLRFLAF